MNAPQTILLVDDEEDLRRGVGRLLQQAGYEVLTAADGEAALAVLRDSVRPALIILDLMMPKLDGYQTLTRLRKGPHKDVPVILLTARSAPAEIGLGYSKGADIYFTKPFEPENLLKAIRFLIGAVEGPEREKLEADLLNANEAYLGIAETQDG